MTNHSLADILEGCRRGREAAMQSFYERYYSYALSVCLAHSGNRDDAREILNDGFLKVFRNIAELKNEDSLLPWLRRIMVNTAIDYYRRSQKQPVRVSTDSITAGLKEPHFNDETIFAQLSAEDILKALHQLPTPYRLVFSLFVLEGYSHREIAERLKITESTSRAHLTEANRRLRQLLTLQTASYHERAKR